MTPIPDVSNSSGALLIRPELVAGLPITRGVDFVEVELARTNFPHRVFDFIPIKGAFNRDLSKYSVVERLDFELIISVQKYVLNQPRLGKRRAFIMPEFGTQMFVTRPVVDYLVRHVG